MTQEAITDKKLRPMKKKRYATLIQLLVVLAFFAVMYYSFAGNVLSKSTEVPMQIGPFLRYQFETEKDAIPQIRRLYSTDMPIDKAYVAHYQYSGTTVNVWFGEAADEDVAKLFNEMTRRIEKGEDAAYADLKKQDVGGMMVYSALKGDEPQYYYRSGKKFVWISIQGDRSNAARILVDTMRATTGSHEGM